LAYYTCVGWQPNDFDFFSYHIFIILWVSDVFVRPAERFGAGVISVCAGMVGVCFVVFAYIVARALLLDRR
jgi:hypothetical protein